MDFTVYLFKWQLLPWVYASFQALFLEHQQAYFRSFSHFVFQAGTIAFALELILFIYLTLLFFSSLPLWTVLPKDETSPSFLWDFYYLHVVTDC